MTDAQTAKQRQRKSRGKPLKTHREEERSVHRVRRLCPEHVAHVLRAVRLVAREQLRAGHEQLQVRPAVLEAPRQRVAALLSALLPLGEEGGAGRLQRRLRRGLQARGERGRQVPAGGIRKLGVGLRPAPGG